MTSIESDLTPAEAVLVDEFAVAFQQAREEKTEKQWSNVLEIFRDGTDTLIADMRAGCFKNRPSG